MTGCDRNGEGRNGCGRPTCGKCYPHSPQSQMTPPDSDAVKKCRCGEPAMHGDSLCVYCWSVLGSKPASKPDSDAREVMTAAEPELHDCKIGYAVACEVAPAQPSEPVAPAPSPCKRCNGTGRVAQDCPDPRCATRTKPCPDCSRMGAAEVPLPLPLAQRILAALEKQAKWHEPPGRDLTDLAADLRAVIGK